MNVYKGALYENVIAEALCKQGYELFYYKKESSTLEQDFFVRTKKSLVLRIFLVLSATAGKKILTVQ